MNVLGLMGIFLVSILLTFVVLCIYIKLLSVISIRLRQRFYKISEPRSDARKDSKIEVCCIYCFDKAYNIFNTYWRLVCGAIKKLIWNKPISKNSYNSHNQSADENRNTDVKSLLPSKVGHKRIIKRLTTKCK